jgi:hypothetical protein
LRKGFFIFFHHEDTKARSFVFKNPWGLGVFVVKIFFGTDHVRRRRGMVTRRLKLNRKS